MTYLMVRYRVTPDQVSENERLVRAVYDELRRVAPVGLRYATFKLDDGVSFVHLAAVETDDGTSPFRGIRAFEEFQRDIANRCDEPPVATEVSLIGEFSLFTSSTGEEWPATAIDAYDPSD